MVREVMLKKRGSAGATVPGVRLGRVRSERSVAWGV